MNKLLLVLTLFSSSLFSEIEEVTLNWNKMQCEDHCIALLERTLKTYPPVVESKIYPEKGMAIVRWNPNSQFDLPSIKRVYQTVGFGFGVGDVQIKVRGTISKKGATGYLLTSLGDGTKFLLLGQNANSNVKSFSTGSMYSYPLTANQRAALDEAIQNLYVVEIAGGIFYVQYDYPMIITQSINVTNKMKGNK